MELKSKNIYIGRLSTITDITKIGSTKQKLIMKQGKIFVFIKFNDSFVCFDESNHKAVQVKDIRLCNTIGQVGVKLDNLFSLCDYLGYESDECISLSQITKIQDKLRLVDQKRKDKKEQEQEKNM